MLEKFGADPLPPPVLGDRHLAELKALLVERLERDRAHHGVVGECAEVPAERIVLEFLLGQLKAERSPQHRLTQHERLPVDVRAERRLYDL